MTDKEFMENLLEKMRKREGQLRDESKIRSISYLIFKRFLKDYDCFSLTKSGFKVIVEGETYQVEVKKS